MRCKQWKERVQGKAMQGGERAAERKERILTVTNRPFRAIFAPLFPASSNIQITTHSLIHSADPADQRHWFVDQRVLCYARHCMQWESRENLAALFCWLLKVRLIDDFKKNISEHLSAADEQLKEFAVRWTSADFSIDLLFGCRRSL
ncbi:unnamed protein product [Toxocara canis]|uniref:Uncharacterized protein n=1 Tax=Toxocara canis TaxID=6265 RepID=A0A183V5S7_TOXCA|nr:unnamed protein product [Toxocara canis]